MTSYLKRFATSLWTLALLLIVAQGASAARTTTFYHTDGLGSIVAASDESGDLLWRKAYAPYGEQIDSYPDTERLAYTGKQHDDAIGLTYFGARYYDPEVGRFTSIDPAGVLEHIERNPMMFNRYAYANNNPYRYVDPDGRSATAVVGGWILTDTAVPEPTDLVVPKWVIYGALISGAAAIDALVFNESNENSPTADDHVSDLTGGLENEKDSRGRDKSGHYIDPDGDAQSALDSLGGRTTDKGQKILDDGSVAGVHDSTTTGDRTLHINRPSGKRDVKIRYPKKSD